jgi:hypothetical protein
MAVIASSPWRARGYDRTRSGGRRDPRQGWFGRVAQLAAGFHGTQLVVRKDVVALALERVHQAHGQRRPGGRTGKASLHGAR